MKRLCLLGAVAALVTWTVLSALTQVQPGERAVVRRFGRILEHKPGPGLFLGLPWGLDQVDRVPVGRVKRVVVGSDSREDEEASETPAGQLLTGDHNLVNVQAEINYTVFEDQVDKYMLQADRADALVARAAETVLAEWIAGRTVDEVLLRGKTMLPGTLVGQVQSRLENLGLGVKIEAASINQLYPPREVKEAFDRVAQAQTNIRTQVYKAEQEADKKKREARAEAFKIRTLAESYARDQHFRAKSDAENFLKRQQVYRQLVADNPNYLNGLWLDQMTRLYARMRQTGRIDVLDHHLSSDGLNITQFPLAPKTK